MAIYQYGGTLLGFGGGGSSLFNTAKDDQPVDPDNPDNLTKTQLKKKKRYEKFNRGR